MSSPSVRYHCEYAWLPTGLTPDVTIEVIGDTITAAKVSLPADGGCSLHGVTLPGVTLPGFANAHSHAFHRALRGRTHHDKGSFWTWREQMYHVAAQLNPDSYYRLARAVYAEMALAGITTVGEFHYLHHDADGRPYRDPNAMGHALMSAAADAGIRITLLDTLYLQAGVDGQPLAGPQLRFTDGDAHRWAKRVAELAGGSHATGAHAKVGAAVHSVRAVPPDQMAIAAEWAEDRPLHAHVSEQRAENEACLAMHGRTPTRVLADAGALAGNFTAVHATHLNRPDIDDLSGNYVCICPTTERDLGDGIGPARALADAGARLTLGSDSHAVIDFFEEARALELDERLARESRGHFSADELLHATTGHQSLGWPDAGRIAPGQRADLVTVQRDSIRTAGCAPDGVLFAANAADISQVIAGGKVVATAGQHRDMDVPRELEQAICALF